MGAIKLLHTSDLHIDWLFENFSPAAKQIRRRELIKSFDVITDLAIQEEVHALLIAGDLFHATKVDRSSLTAVLANLQRLAEKKIYCLLLPGNHDPLTPDSLYNYIDLPPNVHIFREKSWTVFDQIPNLNIYGFPYFDELKDTNILSQLQVTSNNLFQVAMLHGSYKNVQQIENYMPFQDVDIVNSNLNYLALGHYHNFKDCSQGQVKCFYPGAPNCLSFNNTDERQVILVELSTAGTVIKPIAINGRKYVQLNYDMTLGSPVELYKKIEDLKDLAVCLKIIITGLVDESKILTNNEVKSLFAENFFYLEVVDRSTILPANLNLDFTVKGIYLKKMQALLDNPTLSDEEREIIENALKIGFIALERGRV